MKDVAFKSANRQKVNDPAEAAYGLFLKLDDEELTKKEICSYVSGKTESVRFNRLYNIPPKSLMHSSEGPNPVFLPWDFDTSTCC